jgi:hypothetical protein
MPSIWDFLSPPGTHYPGNKSFDENGIALYLSDERRAKLLETLPERRAEFIKQKEKFVINNTSFDSEISPNQFENPPVIDCSAGSTEKIAICYSSQITNTGSSPYISAILYLLPFVIAAVVAILLSTG